MNEGRYFDCSNGGVSCSLCPRLCKIAPGKPGVCGVRWNIDGRPALPSYGHVSAIALDPIEKKPLYHFRPGTGIWSVGFTGCNLRCPFCQNWHISQETSAPIKKFSPKELAAAALEAGAEAIAYTYSEPLVHAEYLLDCMELARNSGIANVLVTNGCVNEVPAADILALTNAANIDLKAFSPDIYRDTLGGELKTVLRFIEKALELGVWVEITTLVVPKINDNPDENAALIGCLSNLSPMIPWHISAYHPDYKWREAPVSKQAMLNLVNEGRKKLRYVYAGNLAGIENDTHCPRCGGILITRRGYSVAADGLVKRETNGKRGCFCACCNEAVPVYW